LPNVKSTEGKKLGGKGWRRLDVKERQNQGEGKLGLKTRRSRGKGKKCTAKESNSRGRQRQRRWERGGNSGKSGKKDISGGKTQGGLCEKQGSGKGRVNDEGKKKKEEKSELDSHHIQTLSNGTATMSVPKKESEAKWMREREKREKTSGGTGETSGEFLRGRGRIRRKEEIGS